ncbi:hypothetical protein GGTG_05115 [Gaeumannomyces tritici R3-111a-1]|uniref:Peptidase A1 domain-containing protein n=1 Tax=Gaeumannomyces tritici (strain R3-111a-1) TaxID=644352 RepID=J3NV06_GAET3|nr:hypothetical protein GGTG_05115 [Gaeumannomyces tritici R3-111a-1]EJT75178.1 hypothetical protein GGTG_05115 [Gaeumannomyces tritici R3-111a-1]
MARTATAVLAAVALAQAGSAMVVDLPVWFRNTYCTVSMPVGTPPQDHLLHFGTGSGTSWMVSEDKDCPNGSRFPRNAYSLNASSTSQDLGVKGSIDYLGGVLVDPDLHRRHQVVVALHARRPCANMPLCSEFNASWAVTFTFSSGDDDGRRFRNLTVRGDQLATSGFADRDDACFPPFDSSENPRLALFGRNFLHRFYTVFNYGASSVEEFKLRIGFGQLKSEFQPPAVIQGEKPSSSRVASRRK